MIVVPLCTLPGVVAVFVMGTVVVPVLRAGVLDERQISDCPACTPRSFDRWERHTVSYWLAGERAIHRHSLPRSTSPYRSLCLLWRAHPLAPIAGADLVLPGGSVVGAIFASVPALLQAGGVVTLAGLAGVDSPIVV